jgi:hypothetical protein
MDNFSSSCLHRERERKRERERERERESHLKQKRILKKRFFDTKQKRDKKPEARGEKGTRKGGKQTRGDKQKEKTKNLRRVSRSCMVISRSSNSDNVLLMCC